MGRQSPVEADLQGLLSPQEIARIEAAATVRLATTGDCIFERGEPASTLFLVRSGEVELQFEEGKSGKRLGPGSLFGELVLLQNGHLRTARAVALTDCALLELGARGIELIKQTSPEAHVALLTRGCRNLLQSERELIVELRQRNAELERTLDFLRRTREELGSSQLRALTDELTGIYNRRCLSEQIDKLIDRARAAGLTLALILIDVDLFKGINDELGHQVGDLVLQAFAQRLRAAVRLSDLPCRVGGDEFAVVLTDLPGPAAATSCVVEVFSAASTITLNAGGRSLHATTSFGGAVLGEGERWPDCYARADASLYLAKRSGRHRLGWERKLMTADGSQS